MKSGPLWYCGEFCLFLLTPISTHILWGIGTGHSDLVSFLCLNFPSTPTWCKWECGWTTWSRFAQVTYSQWASKQASEWGWLPAPLCPPQESEAPRPQGPSGEGLEPSSREVGRPGAQRLPSVPREVSLWLFTPSIVTSASQGALVVKNLPANAGDTRDVDGFDPWVRKIPWKRAWQPTLVFLPGKSRGQWSLLDKSPWGCKESDTTEQPSTHTHTHTHTDTHTHRYTHTEVHTHTQIHRYTHTEIHTHTGTHTQRYTQIHTHTQRYTDTDTHTQTHTHRYTHRDTHTEIHTHTHTLKESLRLICFTTAALNRTPW